jgi:hypothetical protein
MPSGMRRTPIIALAVGVALVVFIAILFAAVRPSPPDITVRHLKSVRFADITTMTFEIKNRTADPYVFFPFEVQVRNGDAWTKFQGWSDISMIHPIPKLDPKSLASYTLNVTNLPAGSVVRFSIRPQKILLGFNGLVRRAELELDRRRQGGGGQGISLNPYDRSSQVAGPPTEPVATEEFIEPDSNHTEK